MAIRDKIRAKFSSKNKTSAPTTKATPSVASVDVHYTGRTDIEYYKPHEIPKSKYRGRVDPEHQEMLQSYSFTDAFGAAVRRSSAALSGTFSPGGTKAFSRRASYVSNVHTPSRSRRSSLSSDENNSFSVPSSGSDSSHMRSSTTAVATGDNLSKVDTVKEPVDKDITNDHIEHSESVAELPFTAEALTQAMTRATITPPMSGRRVSMAVA